MNIKNEKLYLSLGINPVILYVYEQKEKYHYRRGGFWGFSRDAGINQAPKRYGRVASSGD